LNENIIKIIFEFKPMIMKKILKLILCLSMFISVTVQLQAQETRDTSLWVIETVDDNEYVGEILFRDKQIIRLKTQKIGEITIQMKDIKSITKVRASQMVKGDYWFENPHATRYFWGPNGYGLRKGEGYYQNTWIFLNQVSVGVTDNFTIGAGLIPTFLLGGGSAIPIWITPKVSVPIKKDKFNIGVGGLVGGVVGESSELAGIAFGTATVGSRDKNMSLSLGYGFVGDEWANSPVVTFSGMIRTGKRGFFITENYFISAGGETLAIISGGGRYVFKKLAIDFGGFLPLASDLDQFIVLPWLGINVPFGNKTLGE
jgi:hypothetical protein